ncbi:hypothetical protein [Nocardioides flavescens]|uniref:Uncharacterized protein n=1 Tax=Nocardioides flavescens TaxID=2691959 RepID=A0A6L7F484_9ACTN|nr:hypothetical protein [Nocardioides flavescens]MXG92073.1 hypothetical protein [Nocardioides flavescens]
MRISYPHVASTLALVVALGTGGAYAASLPKHSVGAPQLKKNAVTSKAVKNGSIALKDLAPVTMGGDLAGTFPNATVRGVVRGNRVTARMELPAGNPAATLLEVPGIGGVLAICTRVAGSTGLNLYVRNDTGTPLSVVSSAVSQSPASSTAQSASINANVPGGVLAVEFAPAAAASARVAHLATVAGPDFTLDAVAQTGVGVGCQVQVAASSS